MLATTVKQLGHSIWSFQIGNNVSFLLQAVGFVWGYVCQQFSQTMYILLAGVVLSCIVSQTHFSCPSHPPLCSLIFLQLNPLGAWPIAVGVGWLLRSGHSVGTYPETSSHTTCQGTFCHSSRSSVSLCWLILTERVEFMCMSLKKII